DEFERKIRDFEDQLVEHNREIQQRETEIAELKHKHQVEIDQLRAEISHLLDKYQNDLDDEKDQYNKNLESVKLVEDELRNRLTDAEKKLAEARNRENQLERHNLELKGNYDQVLAQVQKLKDDLDDARQDAQNEIQKWKTDAYEVQSQMKTVETENNALKAQLMAVNERAESLNKIVNEQNAKIRDRKFFFYIHVNMQVRRLEEEISDLKSTALTRESDVESALGRLRSVEEQFAALQSEHSKTCNELDVLQREYDLLRSTNTNQESELERLKRKIQQCEVVVKEQKNVLDHQKAERERLQNAYREKIKQLDHFTQLVQSFDTKMKKMRQDLRDTSDKFIAADTERNALHSEVTKLQHELQFGKDQMVRKTDEYQSSLEDLANAHRVAEDGRLNALQELESRKYEMADLKSRLENTEQRLTSLQQDYNKIENERDIMADSLRRFYFVTTHAATLHRIKAGVDHDQTTDKEIIRSVPFPSVDFTSGGRGGAATINIGETLDINQLENTLQTLIGRIEKLECERNEYREALDRLKKKTSDTHTTIHKRETHYKTIEENMTEMEEEKRVLEVRLTSAKHLLRSQEEALKQRDEERRQLKAKMVAFDLEARGKDAQLRHLNEQIKNLRNDLETAQADLRILREHEERWDTNRFQLESKLRDKESETQRLTLLQSNLESEKQILDEKVKELSGQLQLSEIKCTDMKEDIERLKRELSKAETIEIELRKTSDFQLKTINEYQILRDQVTGVQNDLINANNQKQQLEHELVTVRGELRDYKQHLHESASRVSDLQRQLQDAFAEKNRLEERVLTFEKTISSQRSTEDDLRKQIEACKSERHTLKREFDEVQRRLGQWENEKRIMVGQLDNIKRERAALTKKIEMLENEKRRTDIAIRETALQREAIEKSLNAMERENKELYKNCAQLQKQIAQLELENGNRIMEISNKQREEQDKQMLRMRNEKIQIERIIENRERTQQNRIKQLENQLTIMREQLDNERRRRRDYVDRCLAGDIGRLGGGYLGLRNGFHSAGILPHLGEDYLTGTTRFIRSTFVSNPLTPPLGASTPTQYQDVMHRESHISNSSHHSLLVESDMIDGSKVEILAPSQEIEEKQPKTVIVMKASKLKNNITSKVGLHRDH
ncbi:unnamed protein product, partial [Thelazia callipaeda]|uniref:Myosin_tail_1 domain-containing protein n=1 Tax=Thelazia callipaeda TaxID=103827 RepID=A0A0N5CNS6_THECL